MVILANYTRTNLSVGIKDQEDNSVTVMALDNKKKENTDSRSEVNGKKKNTKMCFIDDKFV